MVEVLDEYKTIELYPIQNVRRPTNWDESQNTAPINYLF